MVSAAGVSTKPWFVGDERWRAGAGKARQGNGKQSTRTTRQLSFEQPGPCSPRGTASVPEQACEAFECLAWGRVVGGPGSDPLRNVAVTKKELQELLARVDAPGYRPSKSADRVRRAKLGVDEVVAEYHAMFKDAVG